MRLSPQLTFSLAAGLVAVLLQPSVLAGRATPPVPPTLTTLQPGAFRALEQTLTINVVFVGYEPGAGPRDINEAAFTAALPHRYETIHRYPAFYGLPAKMGVNFDYAYNVVYAPATFEDAFFGYLGSIAAPQPLTLFQSAYNAQAQNALDVTSNHWIDAPSVERWLAANAGSGLGLDTAQYTIFFVNWYGRSDFKFHVYTKVGEPDPDTGYDFGLSRESRKIMAWGGTTPDDEESGLGSLHRIWFYDLSAGPESWTDNWNVDDADLDGNGRTDYRMPPVWEYGNLAGYRPFNNLSDDLGKVARYVGINLLFTTSPLYKPAISPPKLPSAVQVDVNLYQGVPDSDARDHLTDQLLQSELNELQPMNTVSREVNSLAFTGRAAEVYNCFVYGQSCFGRSLFGIAFADLFLYHDRQLLQFIEGDADYEVPVFGYFLPDELVGGLLGFADDNWRDGTQSYVFGFLSPGLMSLGYGFTSTLIHEVGHHLGMSHPHDGYDSETGTDYGPGDEYYFAWSGDESNSIMNYMDLNWDFSQFDRDNMARYLTASYINQANTILAAIYKSPQAGFASAELSSADGHAASALSAYAAMNYAAAALHAQLAYGDVLAAAATANVKVESQAYPADYKAKGASPKFVDRVDYHRNRP